MNFNRREKVLRIIKILFFTILLATFTNMLVWLFICSYTNPSEEVFKVEVTIIFSSFIIVALGAVIIILTSLKQKNLANKFNLFFENKEYGKAEEFFRKEREKTLSLSLFQSFTFYIGYSNMFLDNIDLAYKELYYFLENERVSDYLMHLSSIYYLYAICLIKDSNDDILKIKSLYKRLIAKFYWNKDSNTLIVRVKKYFSYLMDNNIRSGLEPLVKAECPLVINYFSNNSK